MWRLLAIQPESWNPWVLWLCYSRRRLTITPRTVNYLIHWPFRPWKLQVNLPLRNFYEIRRCYPILVPKVLLQRRPLILSFFPCQVYQTSLDTNGKISCKYLTLQLQLIIIFDKFMFGKVRKLSDIVECALNSSYVTNFLWNSRTWKRIPRWRYLTCLHRNTFFPAGAPV